MMLYNGRMTAGISACLLAMTTAWSASAEPEKEQPNPKVEPASAQASASTGTAAGTGHSVAMSSGVLFVPFQDGVKRDIIVHPDYPTTWVVRERIIDVFSGDKAHYQPKYVGTERKRFTIQPKKGAKSTSLTVITQSKRAVFRLIMGAAEDVTHLVIFFEPGTPPAPAADTNTSCPEEPCKDTQATGQEITDGMEAHYEIYPRKRASFESAGYRIEGQLSEQSRVGDTLKFRYFLDNEGLPYAIDKMRIIPRGSKTALPGTDVVISIDADRSLPLEMPHDGELSGSIFVTRGASLLAGGFTLLLLPSGESLPRAPMGFDDEPANKGRVVIRVQGTAGALELTDGLNLGLKDWTTETGIGARLAYGISANLTLEADGAYLTSSKAEFVGVMWDDATGTLERSNKALRVMGGLVFHTGETIVPFVRAAVGPRIFDDNKSLTSGAKADSGLALGFLFAFEVGVDAWIGENLTAGVSGVYSGKLGGEELQSVEGRLHVGYAFKI